MNEVKVAVMAVNSMGEPSLPTFLIQCTGEDVRHGRHYEMAIDRAQAEGYDTFKAFDSNDDAARQLFTTASFFGNSPKVVVVVDEGRVQDVITNMDVAYGTINYDVHGYDKEDIFFVPQYTGKNAAAVGHAGNSTCDPVLADQLLRLVSAENSLYGVPESELYEMCSAIGIELGFSAGEGTVSWNWARKGIDCINSFDSKHLAAVDGLGAAYPFSKWHDLQTSLPYADWVKSECKSEAATS